MISTAPSLVAALSLAQAARAVVSLFTLTALLFCHGVGAAQGLKTPR
jgi:hypothetical protein